MRLVLVGSLLVASLASAQAEPKPKPQKVDFNEVVVGAERQTPMGEFYGGRPKPGPFPNLIKVRTSFIDKLRESVHEI